MLITELILPKTIKERERPRNVNIFPIISLFLFYGEIGDNKST